MLLLPVWQSVDTAHHSLIYVHCILEFFTSYFEPLLVKEASFDFTIISFASPSSLGMFESCISTLDTLAIRILTLLCECKALPVYVSFKFDTYWLSCIGGVPGFCLAV